MHLTSFTDYTLRVLMYVAARNGARTTTAEIATAFKVSESHLNKVVHALGRDGLLRNVRGRGGGLELARPASSINLGAVIRAAETGALVECFDGAANRCVITPVCGLRGVLAEALDRFYATLDRYTLADVTASPRRFARAITTAAHH